MNTPSDTSSNPYDQPLLRSLPLPSSDAKSSASSVPPPPALASSSRGSALRSLPLGAQPYTAAHGAQVFRSMPGATATAPQTVYRSMNIQSLVKPPLMSVLSRSKTTGKNEAIAAPTTKELFTPPTTTLTTPRRLPPFPFERNETCIHVPSDLFHAFASKLSLLLDSQCRGDVEHSAAKGKWKCRAFVDNNFVDFRVHVYDGEPRPVNFSARSGCSATFANVFEAVRSALGSLACDASGAPLAARPAALPAKLTTPLFLATQPDTASTMGTLSDMAGSECADVQRCGIHSLARGLATKSWPAEAVARLDELVERVVCAAAGADPEATRSATSVLSQLASVEACRAHLARAGAAAALVRVARGAGVAAREMGVRALADLAATQPASVRDAGGSELFSELMGCSDQKLRRHAARGCELLVC